MHGVERERCNGERDFACFHDDALMVFVVRGPTIGPVDLFLSGVPELSRH